MFFAQIEFMNMSTPVLTPDQIDNLSLTELNIAVAQARGWKWDDKSVYSPTGDRWARYRGANGEVRAQGNGNDALLFVIPDYARDIAATWELLEQIEDGGMSRTYALALADQLHLWGEDDIDMTATATIGPEDLYRFLTASPEARCRAFLKVYQLRPVPGFGSVHPEG